MKYATNTNDYFRTKINGLPDSSANNEIVSTYFNAFKPELQDFMIAYFGLHHGEDTTKKDMVALMLANNQETMTRIKNAFYGRSIQRARGNDEVEHRGTKRRIGTILVCI